MKSIHLLLVTLLSYSSIVRGSLQDDRLSRMRMFLSKHAFLEQEHNRQRTQIMSLQDENIFLRSLLSAKDQEISDYKAINGLLLYYDLLQKKQIVEFIIEVNRLRLEINHLNNVIGRITH